VVTAAAIMSGIYFGDRGSPVSSSAILVAAVTKTDILDNVKLMMRTGLAALLLSAVIYGVMSYFNPIHNVDQSFLNTLQSEFVISWWCVVPAVFMLVLPLFKVQVLHAMLISIASGVALSLFVQHMDAVTLAKAMIFGYESTGSLGNIINGGGLISMIEVVFIVAISCTYSGIFAGTNMLAGIQDKLKPMMKYIGRFGTMVVVSFATLALFCNQTIASMMCNDILAKPYEEAGASKTELAMDIENSVIVLSATVPWVLACSVPLGFMQVGYEVVPLSFFLFLIPICYGVQKKVANPFR
jgi:NhaC family Na+:H+ antiporter